MKSDREFVIQTLRTVYHYFVTERRSRNYNTKQQVCQYDGDVGNGVGCAVGCCLTKTEAKLADTNCCDVSPNRDVNVEHIFKPMGLIPNKYNSRMLRELQSTHDATTSYCDKPLHDRMDSCIRKICHRRRIPYEELTKGTIYSKT